MSVARNTIVTASGAMVPAAVTLLTVPAYLNLIGPERYGVLALVWTILAYFSLVELGVSGALLQRIADVRTLPDERLDFYWTALAMNTAMGLLGGVALWILFDPIVASMSFSTEAAQSELQSAGPVIAAMLPVMTMRSVNNGVLIGSHRFQAATVLSTLEALGSAIVPLLVAAWFSVSMFWLTLSILALRIAFGAVSFGVMRSSLPGFRFRPVRRALVRNLMSFGLWRTVTDIVGPLLSIFDRMVIGMVSGVSQVPFYTVPQSIFQQITVIPNALSKVLFPKFSSVASDTTANELANRAINAMNIVMTPICVVAILLVEPFLTAWLSAEFAQKAATVAEVIIVGAWANSLARIPVSLLYGKNRPSAVAMAHLVELVPYAIILYALIHSFGLIGVAMAWTLRIGVDAVVLGAWSGLLAPMMRRSVVPLTMLTGAMLVSEVWPMGDVIRWIAAVMLAFSASIWAMVCMPQDLVRLTHKIPGARILPLGRLARN